MQMLSYIHILWQACKAVIMVIHNYLLPSRNLHPWRVPGQSRCAGYTSGTSAPHRTGAAAFLGHRVGFTPPSQHQPPPAPPGDRAEGTGDTDSHRHGTAAPLPPRPHSCTGCLAALSSHGPAKQRGSVAPRRDPGKGQFPQHRPLCPGRCHTAMLSRTDRQELLPGERAPRSPDGWVQAGVGDPRALLPDMLSCAILPAPVLPLLSQKLSPWKLEPVPRWEGALLPFREERRLCINSFQRRGWMKGHGSSAARLEMR